MNELNGYDYEDLKPGMSATFAKTITEADIVLFAAVSGDNNAVHINEEFAQTTRFKGRIAHGMLTASVISAAIAGRMPGPGTVYLSQNLRFKAPVKPGDTVHATVTVVEMLPEKRRVSLTTICRVRNKVVVDGDALVMPTSTQAARPDGGRESPEGRAFAHAAAGWVAEMARKSQTDAMAIITQRASQSLEEIKKLMQPK
jgi:3-hydroxybutyryl-CoA dehydratase